jgi:lysophospholipase L1-like esterase
MSKQFGHRLLTGALLVLSIVFCAFVVNVGARAVFQSNDFQLTHQNGIRVVEYVMKQRTDIYGDDSGIIPHPYLLYTNRPGFSGKGFLQIDANGYRVVPRPERSSSDRPKKVLVLGGSTTYSYPYVPDPANAWPAQLQKILGPGYEVINAGLSSATTAELLAGYVFRHRYLKPDIVIIHEGGNDVVPMLFDHYNAEYTHLRAAGTRPVAGPFDRAMLRWGGWPAKLLYAHNWNLLTTVFSPAPASLAEIPRADALDRAEHAPVTGFERNLDLLVRTIIEDGGTPVLFGFVEAREALLSRNRPDLVGLEHAWKIGIERNLAVMKRIAAARHVVYVDPHEFKAEDDWFLDNCHLNETGEAAKAAFVARSYFSKQP